ncbi:methyl-accepting chemotaxis protein [Bacteriovorax sp. Seq25_V]|uniref:methyl-accepting chemotaxis protein n=1 Tax=Bacteriovorax sp. Seq25_V TaxID=1201288 RepID=UPI00038A54D9|nr:methyl-accepting chemotaxis protein [Bacteriovorax sp. Seq25_V]EQC43825.1 methyl-accepting chemotaxis protein signaling domain protein [Bacteriovorax sp. Seq25_V]
MKKLKNIGLKVQITLMTAIVSAICIVVISFISSIRSKSALLDISKGQLDSTSKLMSDKANEYFSSLETFTGILSKDRLIEGLFIAFEGAFYGGAFSTDSDQKILTPSYISNDKLYGDRIRLTAKDYKLKSIMLVSINGQVIMNSIYDEKYHFLGRSLRNGALKGSALSKCFEQAIASDSNKMFFADYALYQTSGDVHSFICQRALAEFPHPDEGIAKGDVLGVLVTEVDQAYINGILSSREGMGETGQTYLVGEDGILRSNMFIESGKFNVTNSLKENIKIENEAVKNALANNVGSLTLVGPLGKEVLTSYRTLRVIDRNWAFIAEREITDILAPVNKMIYFIVLISFILFGIIVFVSWYATSMLSRPITSSTDHLKEISGDVGENAQIVKKYSEDLGNASGNLASSIQETVSTMDEITQMVNKNLENVDQSTMLSEASKNAATEGLGIVSKMREAMNDINGTNNNITEEMRELSEQMVEIISVIEEIGAKTSVINDIVFQTKLLSFNASVEAARAGEHGKGFSVVAEEVGNLATASGTAATEISTMLQESVGKVQQIVNSSKDKIARVTEEGAMKIQFGQTIATKCGEQLNLILENVNSVHGTISEVKLASNEQATGIREVSKAMQMLDQVSNDTQQISTDILKVAKTLNDGSEELEDIVKIFNNLISGKKKEAISEQ